MADYILAPPSNGLGYFPTEDKPWKRKGVRISKSSGAEITLCDNSGQTPMIIKKSWKSTPATPSNGVYPTQWSHGSAEINPAFIKKETLTENPYYKYIYTGDWAVGFFPTNDPILYQQGEGACIQTITNAENRVITECLARLADQKVNIGVSLAEIGETARTIASLALDGLKLLKAIKRGNVAEIRELFNFKGDIGGSVASRWLQLQYGVRPIMNDIYGLSNLMNGNLSQDDTSLTVRSFKSYTAILSSSSEITTPLASTFSYKSWIQYHCRLTAYVAKEELRALSLLGLTNPAEVVWEVVPFSFVVDWFAPVGTFLQAKNALVGLHYLYGSLSAKGHTYGKIEAVDQTTHCDCYSHYGMDKPIHYKSSMFSRAVLTDPVPAMYVKNPFSMNHTANAAALFKAIKG